MHKYTSHQEIFDKVWNHFIVNKAAPSTISAGGNRGGRCLYDSPQGGCAIGCLIEDREIKKAFDLHDGGTIYSIFELGKFKEFLSSKFDESIDVQFLTALQHAHDDATNDLANFTELFQDELLKIAIVYKLLIPYV